MDFDGGARETASSLSQRCQKFWNAKCVETNKIANTNLAQFAAVDFEHRVVFQNRASLFFSVFFFVSFFRSTKMHVERGQYCGLDGRENASGDAVESARLFLVATHAVRVRKGVAETIIYDKLVHSTSLRAREIKICL